ncbi:MAG: hypothetical protein ACK5HY_15255 [Parahaliea sp.]
MKVTMKILCPLLLVSLASCGPAEQGDSSAGHPDPGAGGAATEFAPYRNPDLNTSTQGGVDYAGVDWEAVCLNVKPVVYPGCDQVAPTSHILSSESVSEFTCDKEKQKLERLRTPDPELPGNPWHHCKSEFHTALGWRLKDEVYFEQGLRPREYTDLQLDAWVERNLPGLVYKL